jgi:hypothetical protein
MPEHLHDPIRELENFDSGGLGMIPLDPAQVRRLGDRRRTRRNALVVAAAAVAVVAAASPALILSNRSDSEAPTPTVTPTAGTTTAPPTTDPTTPPATTAAPQVTTYPGVGVAVKTQADLAKLDGTTDGFKTFIGTVLEQDRTTCPNPEIDVQKYSSAGYAIGGVGGCGGYVALWTIQDGQWKEALGTQDEWRCGDLARFDVPTSFAGQCYGPAALFGPTDDDGLRLGMSKEEVVAAGGTVTGPGNGCDFVFPPGAEPTSDSTLGYLSATPGKGVVALYIQDGQVTPEGIATTSARKDVEAAYPDGHLDAVNGAWIVRIDTGSYYRFDFDSGFVSRVSIVADGQDCYE